MGDDGQDFAGKLKETLENLLILEINTIRKSGMTARKMPTARHAFLDIAQNYCRELLKRVPGFTWPDQLYCHPDTFQLIRTSAKAHSDKLDRKRDKDGQFSPKIERQYMMMVRIMRNSDQMSDLLNILIDRKESQLEPKLTRQSINSRKNLSSLMLRPQEQVLLRKIWEVGVDEVLFQSSIQIDGDVLARVQPIGAKEEFQRVYQFHQDSVKVSLEMWKTLIQTVQDLVKALARP